MDGEANLTQWHVPMITAVEPDLLRRQTPSACILPAFSTSSKRLGCFAGQHSKTCPTALTTQPNHSAPLTCMASSVGAASAVEDGEGRREPPPPQRASIAMIASCRVCPGPEPLVRSGSSNGRLSGASVSLAALRLRSLLVCM